MNKKTSDGGEPVVRRATRDDLEAVAAIYESIHELEASGRLTVGWRRGVYPVYDTAVGALAAGSLFVMESDDLVVASAIINSLQPEAYATVEWFYPAAPERVGVLHTLVVDPRRGHRGLGRRFVAFFEDYCRRQGLEVARLDTQVVNTRPFNLYPRLGYRLAGVETTRFENLPRPVRLAMFEKKL